jgi:Transmembrane amino acid transporter protein
VQTTIINEVVGTIGGGLITVPYLISQDGIFLWLVFTLIGMTLSFTSSLSLLRTSELTGIYSYSDFADRGFPNAVGLFIKLVFIGYNLGCAIINLTLAKEFIFFYGLSNSTFNELFPSFMSKKLSLVFTNWLCSFTTLACRYRKWNHLDFAFDLALAFSFNHGQDIRQHPPLNIHQPGHSHLCVSHSHRHRSFQQKYFPIGKWNSGWS